MKLSLVLIIYRSKSTTAKETASFCENLLESHKIAVIRLASNFDNKTIQRNLQKNDYLPCLLYTSPSPRDGTSSRMPSSA